MPFFRGAIISTCLMELTPAKQYNQACLYAVVVVVSRSQTFLLLNLVGPFSNFHFGDVCGHNDFSTYLKQRYLINPAYHLSFCNILLHNNFCPKERTIISLFIQSSQMFTHSIFNPNQYTWKPRYYICCDTFRINNWINKWC